MTPLSIVVEEPAASESIIIALFAINILYCGREELLVLQLTSIERIPERVVGTVFATEFALADAFFAASVNKSLHCAS